MAKVHIVTGPVFGEQATTYGVAYTRLVEGSANASDITEYLAFKSSAGMTLDDS